MATATLGGTVASPPTPLLHPPPHPGPACIILWLAESNLKDLRISPGALRIYYQIAICKSPLSPITHTSPSVCMVGICFHALAIVIGSVILLTVCFLDKDLLLLITFALSSTHPCILLLCQVSAWVNFLQIQVISQY